MITEEFWSEYDELSGEVASSTHQFFAANLQRWFAVFEGEPVAAAIVRDLQSKIQFEAWLDGAKKIAKSGSGGLFWPPEREKRLGLQLTLFRKFMAGEMTVPSFVAVFGVRDSNINVMVSDIGVQIFGPTSRELKRYLTAATRQASGGQVPASDRVVSLNHNSAAYLDSVASLEAAEQAIQDANDYNDQADKEQRIAEISAGRRLLRAGRVRIAALAAVLGTALLYLAKKFIDTAVGKAAAAALSALKTLFQQDWPTWLP